MQKKNSYFLKKTILVSFFVLFVGSFFVYHLAFYKKIIPFVYINNVNVGGLIFDKAYQKLSFLNSLDNKLVFTYKNGGQETFFIKPSDIGYYYDLEKTLDDAFAVGRSGNFIKDQKAKFNSLFGKKTIALKSYYNEALLNDYIEKIKVKVNEPYNDAYFFMENNNIVVKNETKGLRLDEDKFKAEIFESFLKGEEKTYELPVYPFVPKKTKADLEQYLSTAQKALNTNPTVAYDKKIFMLAPNEVLMALYVDNGGLKVNKTALDGFAKKIALELNTPPKGEVFKVDNNKVLEFRSSSPGIVVLEDELVASIANEISTFSGEQKEIQVSVKKTLVEENSNKYGIKEIIGEGVSYFKGSDAGRAKNIEVGSAKVSGTLIPPGDEFSFVKAIGEIDLEHGFSTAYIIEKGRTVLGPGGGVCQVSTTVFRAALNSGLPITTRYPHAYRVSWYEPPVGLDATVFAPSVDLKFKNDTPAYILITSEVDKSNATLTFRFYGTSDGRKTTLTEPVIAYQTAPPEPKYQETDTLLKGVTKQIEYPAWGAKVSFERKIEKIDGTILNDSFISNYRPWGAVYLVGTKE